MGLGPGVVVTVVPGVDVVSVTGVVEASVASVAVVSVIGVVVSVAGGVFTSGDEALAVDEVKPTEDVVGVPTGGTNTVLD